jgi:hypothetical protein
MKNREKNKIGTESKTQNQLKEKVKALRMKTGKNKSTNNDLTQGIR